MILIIILAVVLLGAFLLTKHKTSVKDGHVQTKTITGASVDDLSASDIRNQKKDCNALAHEECKHVGIFHHHGCVKSAYDRCLKAA